MNRYMPDDCDLERWHELEQRLDRDDEREPRSRVRVAPRRRQFRYWSGLSFRPVRREFARTEQVRSAS